MDGSSAGRWLRRRGFSRRCPPCFRVAVGVRVAGRDVRDRNVIAPRGHMLLIRALARPLTGQAGRAATFGRRWAPEAIHGRSVSWPRAVRRAHIGGWAGVRLPVLVWGGPPLPHTGGKRCPVPVR